MQLFLYFIKNATEVKLIQCIWKTKCLDGVYPHIDSFIITLRF